MNDMKNKDTEFSVDIYRNCNMNLNEYTNDQLLNDYNTHGMYENKIATTKQLYKKQSIINQDLMKANIAIFIKVINNSDTFNNVKSILQKIKLMTENCFADIYIGYDLNNDNYYHGLSTIYEDINSQYNIIDSFDIIDITKYNFYLGYNLQRKYDTIIEEII
jgi:ssDNA-specific exonuclease RecJ